MEVWRQISAGRLPSSSERARSTTTGSSGPSAGGRPRNGTLPRSRAETRAVLDAYAAGVNAWLEANRGRPRPRLPRDRHGSRTLDRARHARLGQGPGLEPRRQLRHRALPVPRRRAPWRPGRTDELFARPRVRAGHRPPTPDIERRVADGRGRTRQRAADSRTITRARGRRVARTSPRSARTSCGSPASTARRRPCLRSRDRLQQLGRRPREVARPAAPCSPTTRTSASRCRRSGSSTASIARPSTTPARTTSPASASRASRASSSATTPGSRGARRTPIPTSRTSSSRPSTRPIRPATSGRDGASLPFTVRHRADRGRRRRTGHARGPRDRPRPDPQRRRRAADRRPLMALRWAAIHPRPPRTGRSRRSWASTRPPTSTTSGRACRSTAPPSQNFVYADVDGHIGYQLPGYVPVRSDPGDRGDRPVRGSTATAEWIGRIPFERPALGSSTRSMAGS